MKTILILALTLGLAFVMSSCELIVKDQPVPPEVQIGHAEFCKNLLKTP